MSAPLQPCIHCKKRKQQPGRRDLCSVCYKNSLIRMQYPKRQWQRMPEYIDRDEPTEEELDKMIAERLPTMPRKTIEEMLEDREYTTRMEPYRIPIIRVVGRHNNTNEYRIT